MIKPTIGRVVWYRPPVTLAANAGWHVIDMAEPMAAVIAFVLSDGMVNLTVFDHVGDAHAVPHVFLRQDEQDAPAGGHYAEWMPYQIGQAKKTEETEAKLAEANRPNSAPPTPNLPNSAASLGVQMPGVYVDPAMAPAPAAAAVTGAAASAPVVLKPADAGTTEQPQATLASQAPEPPPAA